MDLVSRFHLALERKRCVELGKTYFGLDMRSFGLDERSFGLEKRWCFSYEKRCFGLRKRCFGLAKEGCCFGSETRCCSGSKMRCCFGLKTRCCFGLEKRCFESGKKCFELGKRCLGSVIPNWAGNFKLLSHSNNYSICVHLFIRHAIHWIYCLATTWIYDCWRNSRKFIDLRF